MTENLFDLTGRVAMVTGTSRGLGQHFGRALARAGADLILTSRTRSSLADFAAEIEALGRRTASVELDVRDHASIQNAVREAHSAFGKIDILVNNSGCNVRKPALEVTWDVGTSCSLPTSVAPSSPPRHRHVPGRLRGGPPAPAAAAYAS